MKDKVSRDHLKEIVASFSTRGLAPGLYVVGTPIGNLEDLSFRALRVLQQADLIACEDTRQTQKLLNYFGIQRPTVSYHQHNEIGRSRELLEKLEAGARIAVVSDAGMPGISDPGAVVILEAVRRGIQVIPVPGPSALISALVASGLPTESFRFVGFLPARSGQRRTFLEQMRSSPETLVCYEAPHRVVEALEDVVAAFGPERKVVVGRELTKLHEEFLRGSAAEVLKQLREKDVKGEITLLIAGSTPDQSAPRERKDLGSRLRELIAEGADEKTALKTASKEFGLSKSDVYREWQRVKK